MVFVHIPLKLVEISLLDLTSQNNQIQQLEDVLTFKLLELMLSKHVNAKSLRLKDHVIKMVYIIYKTFQMKLVEYLLLLEDLEETLVVTKQYLLMEL
jgi:hypothetical protein